MRRLSKTLSLQGEGVKAFLHRLGLCQLTESINARSDERLAERHRIAQELHDTLLQGFLSASLQLQVAVEHLPADSAVKPQFNRIAHLMRQMIDEGRTAIQGLRSSRGDLPDLKQAFASVQNELALQTTIEFRTLVEGRPRQLRSALRDEVYWIGREAIVNAYRHSRARNIETTIEYGPDRFRIVVCDNGCGVDPNVLRSGRTGHWGIQGMRERAERISARLRVFSGARAGTEIELCVPGKVAYAQIRTSDPVLTNDPGKARGR